MNKEERLKEIQKKLFIYQGLSYPASAAIGFGLYGIYGPNGDAFWSALNNIELCYVLVSAGLAVEIFIGFKLFPLWKEQTKLKSAKN